MFAGVDHVSIRFSLRRLRQGIHPAAPHLRRRKDGSGLSTLRRQARPPAGCVLLRRHLKEELKTSCRFSRAYLRRSSRASGEAIAWRVGPCVHRDLRTQCAIENPLATTHTPIKTAIVHSNGADCATRSTCRPKRIASSDNNANRTRRAKKLISRILQSG